MTRAASLPTGSAFRSMDRSRPMSKDWTDFASAMNGTAKTEGIYSRVCRLKGNRPIMISEFGFAKNECLPASIGRVDSGHAHGDLAQLLAPPGGFFLVERELDGRKTAGRAARRKDAGSRSRVPDAAQVASGA